MEETTTKLIARESPSGRNVFLCSLCAGYPEGEPHPLCESGDCECLCTRPATGGTRVYGAVVQAPPDHYAPVLEELGARSDSVMAAMIQAHPQPERLVDALKRLKKAGEPVATGQVPPRVAGTGRDWLAVGSLAAAVVLCAVVFEWDRPRTSPKPPAATLMEVHDTLPVGFTQSPEAQLILQAGGSVPMPSEPFPWQKRAPCDTKRGELEFSGGCYYGPVEAKPPCVEYAVEKDGKCYVPAPAKPEAKKPPRALE